MVSRQTPSSLPEPGPPKEEYLTAKKEKNRPVMQEQKKRMPVIAMQGGKKGTCNDVKKKKRENTPLQEA